MGIREPTKEKKHYLARDFLTACQSSQPITYKTETNQGSVIGFFLSMTITMTKRKANLIIRAVNLGNGSVRLERGRKHIFVPLKPLNKFPIVC